MKNILFLYAMLLMSCSPKIEIKFHKDNCDNNTCLTGVLGQDYIPDESPENESADNSGDEVLDNNKIECPNDFALVGENKDLGVESFCVMIDEARVVNNKVSTDRNLSPWTNVTIRESVSLCRDMGSKYDLISNEQWIAMSREIEMNPENWRGNSVGEGAIFLGNSGKKNKDEILYRQGNNPPHSNNKNKRALYLSNGNIVWDVVGNVWEWNLPSKGKLYPLNTNCSYGWRSFSEVLSDCSGLEELVLSPLNPEMHTDYEVQGIGMFYGMELGEGYILRGSSVLTSDNSGLYSIALDANEDSKSFDIGFRCVMNN